MARKGPFDDSDGSEEDSVATDTTVCSSDGEYDLEEILGERTVDGRRQYLLFWQGYVLHEASWENSDSLTNADTLLEEWAEKKARVGESKVEEWEQAVNQSQHDKFLRVKRRLAKRKRREAREGRKSARARASATDDEGVVVPGSTSTLPTRKRTITQRREVYSSDSDSAEHSSPKKSKVSRTKRIAPAARKGMAVRMKKPNQTSDSEDEVGSADENAAELDSDHASLFEGSLPSSQPGPQTQKASVTAAPSGRKGIALSKGKPVSSKPSSKQTPTTMVPAPAMVRRTALNTASKATAHRTPKGPFTSEWDKPKQRRQRERVSDQTPKDSTDPKFRSLQVQNRYQKYSRNEPTPDLSALTIIDPKTGKAVPPVATQALMQTAMPATAKAKDATLPFVTQSTSGVSVPTTSRAPAPTAVMFPRPINPPLAPAQQLPPMQPTQPKEPTRKDSFTPPPPLRDTQSAYRRRSPREERRRSISPPTARRPSLNPTQSMRTCPDWLYGSCKHGNECRNCHYEITCPFWQRGYCKLPRHACQYIHEDTGHYIPAPDPRKSHGAEAALELPRVPSGFVVPRSETTCSYWLRGGCIKSQDECDFAHRDTGHYAHRTILSHLHGGERETNLRPEAPLQTSIAGEIQPESGLGPGLRVPAHFAVAQLPKSQVTCFFWDRDGYCKYANSTCIYAHHHTGMVANDPSYNKRSSVSGGQVVEGRISRMIKADTEVRTQIQSASMGTGIKGVTSTIKIGVEVPPRMDTGMQDDSFVDHPNDTSMNASPAGTAILSRPPVPTEVPYETTRDPRLRNRTTLTKHPATILVQVGDKQATVHADLAISDLPKLKTLLYPEAHGASDAPLEMEFDRVMMLKDLEGIPELCGTSNAVCSFALPTDPDSSTNARTVADLCVDCEMAYLAAFELFTVLLYPNAAEGFEFLDASRAVNTQASQQTALRLRIGPAIASLSERLPYVLATPNPDPCDPVQQKALARVLKEADPKQLVPDKDRHNGERGVVIIMPDEHQTEMDMIEEYFKKHGCHVVQHSLHRGAWERFVQNFEGIGTVVVHRETELGKIPNLFKMLDKRNYNVLSFGIQLSYDEMMLYDREASYRCERYFPMGRVTFITDDVFLYAPKAATDMINAFLEKTKFKPEGGETGKIVTRPSIKTWLQTLAFDESVERFAHRDEYVMLYYAMCELYPLQAQDYRAFPDAQGNPIAFPGHRSHVISKVGSDPDWSWMRGLWERDPTLYTDKMVEWFAAFSAGPLVTKFRRMVVVHEPREGKEVMKDGKHIYEKERDPRRWAHKYQHLGVLRPREWIDTHK